MGEAIKICRDCKWCRPQERNAYAFAYCAAPALTSKPDLVTGTRTMRLCTFLRDGGPLDIFGSFFAPCGKRARHFEAAAPTAHQGTDAMQGGVDG